MGKLTQGAVKAALNKPGKYHDENGLMLLVSAPGKGSWVARIQHNNKRRDYGLGSLPTVGLAVAREKAQEVKRALNEGRDPRTLWQAAKGMELLFRETALAMLDDKFSGKTKEQAKSRLSRFVFPKLGKLQLQSITADNIADTLRPIWLEVPEAALRTRELVIRVLRYGRPDGPLLEATMARAVSDRLPPQPARGNFAAMPYAYIPGFMRRLKQKPGMGALALRLGILTAVRPGEARLATWEEFDLIARVWTIPGKRMKKRREHRVPLSPQALAVLKEAAEFCIVGTSLVFPGAKGGEPMSDATVRKCLRDMGEPYTVHAMRSTFRDWAAENTETELHVGGAALSHQKEKTSGAYLRTDFLGKRKPLMEQWGRYACGETDPHGERSSNVTALDMARRA